MASALILLSVLFVVSVIIYVVASGGQENNRLFFVGLRRPGVGSDESPRWISSQLRRYAIFESTSYMVDTELDRVDLLGQLRVNDWPA